jgi:hypothetical protein
VFRAKLCAMAAVGTWLAAADLACAGSYDIIDLSKGGLVAVDVAHIQRTGSLARAWSINLLPDGKLREDGRVLRGFVGLDEYDCAALTSRHVYVTGYSASGAALGTESKPSDWEPVTPDTNGDQERRIACGETPPTENPLDISFADLVAAYDGLLAKGEVSP